MPQFATPPLAVRNLAPLDIDPTLAFEHPILKRGYEYWLEIAAGRSMPARTDIDPLTLGGDLKYVSLFNLYYTGDGQVDLSPRLIGSDFAEVFYRLDEGPLHDVLAPDVMERWLTLSMALLEAARPLRVTGRVQHMAKHHIYFEMLLAPLSDGGEDIRNMYVVQHFEPRPLG